MNKVEIIEGKKQVKLNYYVDKYYPLKYDWPLDTVFNLNGSLDEQKNARYREGKVYIEVFTHSPENAASFFGYEAITFEKCEDILWEKYQSYIVCEHEFSRDTKDGTHYSNGVGVCKHCGMFKSDVFEPETVCDKCGIHAESITLIDGRKVCDTCYKKESWTSKIGCQYFTDDTFMEYLRTHKAILESYSMEVNKDDQNDIKSMKYTVIKTDKTKGTIEWEFERVDNGVLKVKNIKIEDFYMLAKILFGPIYQGKYYLLPVGVELMKKKREMIHNNIRNGFIELDYSVQEELESMERVLENK